MSINNLPPLPPSLCASCYDSERSANEPVLTAPTGSLLSIQIKELQALITKFQADLEASSPNYETIASDLTQLDSAIDTLQSTLNHAGLSTLEGYLTQLSTDIGNKN